MAQDRKQKSYYFQCIGNGASRVVNNPDGEADKEPRNNDLSSFEAGDKTINIVLWNSRYENSKGIPSLYQRVNEKLNEKTQTDAYIICFDPTKHDENMDQGSFNNAKLLIQKHAKEKKPIILVSTNHETKNSDTFARKYATEMKIDFFTWNEVHSEPSPFRNTLEFWAKESNSNYYREEIENHRPYQPRS